MGLHFFFPLEGFVFSSLLMPLPTVSRFHGGLVGVVGFAHGEKYGSGKLTLLPA